MLFSSSSLFLVLIVFTNQNLTTSFFTTSFSTFFSLQGIVGLPNVGKSSLFNLLAESGKAEAANFPFCTIDPNESRCPVPDKRYKFLCDLWDPPSKYPAYLQLMDIAGLIKGASEGAGLGNEFLSNISAVDGLYHVVRAFDDMDVVHVEGKEIFS